MPTKLSEEDIKKYRDLEISIRESSVFIQERKNAMRTELFAIAEKHNFFYIPEYHQGKLFSQSNPDTSVQLAQSEINQIDELIFRIARADLETNKRLIQLEAFCRDLEKRYDIWNGRGWKLDKNGDVTYKDESPCADTR